MRILALDQATRTSGWAVYNDKELIKYGKFSTTSDDMGDRLLQIRKNIIKLIEDYDIEAVIFEDIQLQNNKINNVDTFKKLAEVIGVLCELFAEMKMPAEAVISTVWKSKLGIKGYDRTA